MNTEFRIVSNGHLFKIQKKVRNVIHIPFITARYCWADIGKYWDSPKFYSSVEDAEKDLVKFQNYEKKRTEWTEVRL